MSRSFQFSMVLVAITAGIAQAIPDISGTTLLPLRPNGFMMRSIRNTTRDMYPLSSSIEINRNRNAICGIKMTTPPTPATIPSANKSVSTPEGKVALIHSLVEAKKLSIASIG